MTPAPNPLIGARVNVGDDDYTGPAIVLEYDPEQWGAPYYCHLLDLCNHEGTDEACDDPNDECMFERCRGWYGIQDVAAP